MGNRERILKVSKDLFNQSGITEITTNHIVSHLGISPGNLYFHFDNKEEILRNLYKEMTLELSQLWGEAASGVNLKPPLEFIDRTFELFYSYRFFHREMYALRRKDQKLSKLWKFNIQKASHLLEGTFDRWAKAGYIEEIKDKSLKELMLNLFMLASSYSLLFYESRQKVPQKRLIDNGRRLILRILLPHFSASYRKKVEHFLNNKPPRV